MACIKREKDRQIDCQTEHCAYSFKTSQERNTNYRKNHDTIINNKTKGKLINKKQNN